MLAYADDIVIIGDTENDVVKATQNMIESGRFFALFSYYAGRPSVYYLFIYSNERV